MITNEEIEQRAEAFELPPQQVEKDYVHSWVLWALNYRPELRRLLILKGGNALRKSYLPETRFSKDLDFSSVEHVDPGFLAAELREVCRLVQGQTGVRFIGEDTRVEDKNLPFDVDALEARIYFRGFYNEEKLTLKTQLDVTQFDTIYLPVQERPILHPYSDQAACTGTIRCQKAEEILASKLTTLLRRRRPGDLFDLLYSLIRSANQDLNRREIIGTFLKKSIFEPRPNDARDELLAIPLDDFRPTWTSLLVPAASVFAFDFALTNFTTLINSLFDLAAPALAAGGLAAPARGGGFTRVTDFSFVRGNARSAILEAIRTNRLIEVEYSGHRRIVEPYEFEYYVRKSDGVGNEYLWVWDTTGGKSGPGIKRFFADKVRNVTVTGQNFNPRYAVGF